MFNVLLALLSVIPAFLMLDILNKERPFIKNGSKKINNILMLFYIAVVAGGGYNAFLSTALIFNVFDNNNLTQVIFNGRNVIISASYMIISWGLYFLRKFED